jgi:E3 ubiquitin-protein ligase RNF5
MNTSQEEVTLNGSHDYIRDMEERFACNICFDNVKSPVVTNCGHLYCWPCLFQWLEPGMTLSEKRYLDSSYNEGMDMSRAVTDSRRICPVCKSPCAVKEIVPIYVRECKQEQQRTNTANNASTNNESDDVKDDDIQNEEAQINQSSIDVTTSEEEEVIVLEDDNHNVNGTTIHESNSHNSELMGAADTGLRRRRTTAVTEIAVAPSRPLPPPSTIQPRQSNPTRNNAVVVPVHNPEFALYGSLFQAVVTDVQAIVSGQTSNSHSSADQNQGIMSPSSIPSIHNRRNNGNIDANGQHNTENRGGDDESFESIDAATQFLCRLMFMLGCFVILCLLLF